MKEYFCILGGGGIRGSAYSGVIKALLALNIKLTGWMGSSIGAVVASLVTFNYEADEIKEIFDNINFEFFRDINLNIGKDFSFSKGNNFYEWMKNKIESKFYPDYKENNSYPPVKFSDIDSELVILSFDLITSKPVIFSKEKTPDVEIAHAIRCSVAMPGLYSPVLSDNGCLADGDLIKTVPLSFVYKELLNKKEGILEFRLESNEKTRKVSNTVEYLNAVYDSISGYITDHIIKTYNNYDKLDFIKINLDGISVADFMINKEKKDLMEKIGYDSTVNYFKEIYPKKQEMLNKIYLNFYEKCQRIISYTNLKMFNEAVYETLNVLSDLIENKEIVDKNILSQILNFKKLYTQSLITKKSLFGTKTILIEKNKILSELNNLKDDLGNKIKTSKMF